MELSCRQAAVQMLRSRFHPLARVFSSDCLDLSAHNVIAGDLSAPRQHPANTGSSTPRSCSIVCGSSLFNMQQRHCIDEQCHAGRQDALRYTTKQTTVFCHGVHSCSRLIRHVKLGARERESTGCLDTAQTRPRGPSPPLRRHPWLPPLLTYL